MNMNEILKQSRSEQIAYWVGFMCIAIGRGELNNAIHTMIDFYQKEAYERGVKDGKEQAK